MTTNSPVPKIAAPEEWVSAEGMLRHAQHILAISHVNPDGDAIGSLLGFTLAMRAIGKTVTPCLQDAPSSRFGYISGFHDIKRTAQGEVDLLVSLDASDLQRLGSVFEPGMHGRKPMVVFDHHITNTLFGSVNVIEPGKASTAEIVYKLVRRMDIRLSPEIAVALLTGLVTDTLAFRTSNVTPDTLACATDLMSAGASLTEITRQALVLQPFERIKFHAAGVATAKVEAGVIYAVLSRKLRKEQGYEERGDAGLVGTLITAEEASVAAVFSETDDGKVEISLRSMPGFDVSQVALELGGGGHPAAAGCTVAGPMRTAVHHVLPMLKRIVAKT